MDIVSQINKYLEVFLTNNLDEQNLSKMQTEIYSAINNANVVELISTISELEPRIAYLETKLEVGDNSDDFEQMAKENGLSRGELFVNLSKEIKETRIQREHAYKSIQVLNVWKGSIKSEVDNRTAGMSVEEKQQLYTDLTNVIRKKEQQIDVLSREITHRNLQTDEEIQKKAEINGKTFQQVKGRLELEVMQRNLQISNLKEQNNVINNYKRPLIESIEIAVHRPR